MRTAKHTAEPKFQFTNSGTDPTPNWRTRINQTQLVSQACTIILQRHTKLWAPLLKSLKFSSNFTPSLFHHILNKIQTRPEICLSFFNWAKKNLDFKPDLKAQCDLTRILFGSGSELSKHGKTILNSIVQDYPPSKIVPLLIHSKKGANFLSISPVLNSVVECYCCKHMYLQSLEVYQNAKQYKTELTLSSCNALLSLLVEKNELKLAWCFSASMIRNGLSGDEFTWYLMARTLCKDGKFERVSRILDMGIYTPGMFDLMIEGYSKRGDFEAAFDYLNEMLSERIEHSFSTYSSILDGACKYQNNEMIENVMSFMVENGYLSEPPFTDYDMIIEKLCNLGKTYAMDMFFKRACDEKIELHHATYGCMFGALLSEQGRAKDAIELYNVLREKNVLLNESRYNEFVIVLSNENPSEKVSKLLVDIVRRGFSSSPRELSEYIRKLCEGGRWREAEELFDLFLDQGCLLDSLAYCYFVEHYCYRRKIDWAIMLHNKLQGLNSTLDKATYNVLLAALFKEKRIEEATKVFQYMKTRKMLSCESFSLMIRGLCDEKELRKAMKLHDEMLELGLKPDLRSYKRLICGFK